MKGLFLKGAYIQRGLSREGNLRFKIDWATLLIGRKSTFLLCFSLYLRAISKYKPPERLIHYIWRGDLTEGFCVTSFGGLYLGLYLAEGLIHGGAYFRNFTVTVTCVKARIVGRA